MGEHADWKDLAGRQVQVRKEGRSIRTGYVKDVAVTADALWLEAYGAGSLTLYERARGYTVLPIRPGEAGNPSACRTWNPSKSRSAKGPMDRCITAADDGIKVELLDRGERPARPRTTGPRSGRITSHITIFANCTRNWTGLDYWIPGSHPATKRTYYEPPMPFLPDT